MMRSKPHIRTPKEKMIVNSHRPPEQISTLKEN